MNRLFINTSIEDMTSSLKLMNPSNEHEAHNLIDTLWTNLRKLLRNKIKNTYKMYQ
jgi:hypothetical protein